MNTPTKDEMPLGAWNQGSWSLLIITDDDNDIRMYWTKTIEVARAECASPPIFPGFARVGNQRSWAHDKAATHFSWEDRFVCSRRAREFIQDIREGNWHLELRTNGQMYWTKQTTQTASCAYVHTAPPLFPGYKRLASGRDWGADQSNVRFWWSDYPEVKMEKQQSTPEVAHSGARDLPAPSAPLQPGDVVVLKSGGPAMTILQLLVGNTCRCMWFGLENDGRTPSTSDFPAHCLERAE